MQQQPTAAPRTPNLWMDQDTLLSGRQVEELTEGKLTDQLLRDWRSSGNHRDELPVVRIGRSIYYKRSTILEFLAEQPYSAAR